MWWEGAHYGERPQSHRPNSMLENEGQELPSAVSCLYPKVLFTGSRLPHGSHRPCRMLRELWHCPPAPAGRAASAVGSRPGWGWQETEARLTAQEVALQTAGFWWQGGSSWGLGLGLSPRPKVSLGNLELAHLPKPPESPILDDKESTGLGLWGWNCALLSS